jgi:NADH-quinone oxidoreductase subunit L
VTLVLVIVLPLLGAVAVVGMGHRSRRAVQLLGTAPLAAAWVLALVVAGRHWGSAVPTHYTGARVATGGIGIHAALAVDQLTASMLVLATTVALLVQVYSVRYLATDPRYPSYTAFVLLFTSAMALVVAADDMFVLLVGWEVMGACSYVLIAHYWERAPARSGAARAFVMTRLGDVGLLFGIFVLGDAAGTYRISGILTAVHQDRVGTGQATAACLLLLCGVVGKSAQFPLHTWLPDAMPGPTPITALIHAATMVAAGVYLVARLEALFARSTVALDVLAAISVLTLVGAACFAFVAEDLKRVLAWSTVSQLGYMFAALSLLGYREGVLHLLSHGAFKALLFLAAGSVILVTGRQRLPELGGLWRRLPLTFATMTVGFAALAGIPPFVGFFSKDAIVGLAAHDASAGSGRAWLVLLGGVLGAGITAAYSLRAWLLVFFGAAPPAEQPAPAPVAAPAEPSALMTGPLLLLAIVVTAGGAAVVSPGFLDVSAAAFRPVVMAVTLAVIAVGLLATYLGWRRLGCGDPAALLGRLRRPFDRELEVDAAIDRGPVAVAMAASRATFAAESGVVSRVVYGTESVLQLAGRSLRRAHAGLVPGYLMAAVVGAVAVAVIVGVVQG